MALSVGSAFINADRRTDGAPAHLWVIIAEPSDDPQSVLIVNISTLRGAVTDDTTCILEAGEHPFIHKRSFVAYRFARKPKREELLKLLDRNLLYLQDPVVSAVLERIRNGAKNSPNLPIKYRPLLDSQ